MPQTFARGEQDATRMQVESNKKLMSWANALPFGAAGFSVTRDSSGASIPAGTTGVLAWNVIVKDYENWCSPTAEFSNITVPRGLSGIYVMSMAVVWGTLINAVPAIRLNGAAVSLGPFITQDRGATHALVPLNEGDVITASLFNGGGVSLVPLATAADGNFARSPYLQAWRISLL